MAKNLYLWVDTEQPFFSSKTYSPALSTSTIAAKLGTFRTCVSVLIIDKLGSVTCQGSGSQE
jgi:hypothetical protein